GRFPAASAGRGQPGDLRPRLGGPLMRAVAPAGLRMVGDRFWNQTSNLRRNPLMKEIIASLLESYERGKVSRRQLIQGLAAIAGSAHTVPAFGSTFQGVGLNHITIRITKTH